VQQAKLGSLIGSLSSKVSMSSIMMAIDVMRGGEMNVVCTAGLY
jgi:hypothetical protein